MNVGIDITDRVDTLQFQDNGFHDKKCLGLVAQATRLYAVKFPVCAVDVNPGLILEPENGTYCEGFVTIDYFTPRRFRGPYIIVCGAYHNPPFRKASEEIKNAPFDAFFTNDRAEIGDYLVTILEMGQNNLSYFAYLVFHDEIFALLFQRAPDELCVIDPDRAFACYYEIELYDLGPLAFLQKERCFLGGPVISPREVRVEPP